MEVFSSSKAAALAAGPIKSSWREANPSYKAPISVMEYP